MIKIITPESLKELYNHLVRAGWIPEWEKGKPSEMGNEPRDLKKGIIIGKDAEIAKVRSSRIPLRVASGRYDVGIVGTDCLLDHMFANLQILDGYAYGRKSESLQPYLEIVASSDSTVSRLDEIPIGTTMMTERPHLTERFLRWHGYEILRYEETMNEIEFRRHLIENDSLGISIIPGSGAQQIQEDELLAIVTESGQTNLDYELESIAKICDIEALVIVNRESLANPEKSELIESFRRDMDSVTITMKEAERRTSSAEKGW